MSTPGRSPAGEGMYCHLLDEDGSFTIEPAVGVRPGFQPVRPPAVAQRYRLATVCLVVLSAALLVAVIIIAAQHQRNQPRGGTEESSSSSSALQTQGQNVSTMVASIKKLQQEKAELQQENHQLQQEKVELQQQNHQLQQEKQQLQQEKQQLQQEKQQLQQEKQQLQQEKQQLEQEKVALQKEKQQLQQEKQQLQQEKVALQKEKQQLQQEKAELLSRLSPTKGPEVIGQSSGTPPVLLPCPDGWQTFSSSCYLVSKTEKSWFRSKDDCSSRGGYLAIITTPEEQTFVWNLLPRGHWNAFWIGITDQETEDQWTWVDGTPLSGGFWEVGEPNNHIDEDCGYVVKTQVLERVAIRSWYDAPCTMTRRFICELERGGAATNTTSTSPL